MALRWKPALLWGLLALLAISILGGQAIWTVLGFGDDLTIEGRAGKIAGVAPDGAGTGWSAYGGDAGGNRYAAASQITPANVSDLEIGWQYRSGALEPADRAGASTAFEVTPILAGDRLIFCTQFQDVIALDPGTGEELWRYDSDVENGRNPGNQYICRGVSHWRDSELEVGAICASRVFVGTVDSRIISLDAATGEKCGAFGQGGQVQLAPSTELRWPGETQITSAPAIIGDIIVTGSAVSDNVRTQAPFGTVYAFNARTGEPAWQFNPIPQDRQDPAYVTWEDGSAERTGHANVWSTISVDEARGLVFLPTSSPSPDYFGGNREGDNRYANSLVALDAETGSVAWHFQTVHHDLWDFDIPTQPGLYQVHRDGEPHDVVAIATKAGQIFVLDRDTGEPFVPVEERPVPQDGAPGEVLSPTQPFSAIPAVVPNRLDPGNAFGLTLWDKLACRSAFKSLRAEGLYTPPTLGGALAYPFIGGGANWGSMAYDRSRNLMVVNMTNMASSIRLVEHGPDAGKSEAVMDGAEYAPMEGAPYGMERRPILSPLGLPCSPPPWGVLAGVNIDTGEIVWRQTLGTTEDLAGGIALSFGTPNFGGPMITGGGLVFIGATMDDYLRAFDVETGKELWQGRLPAGGQATPMSYVYKGRQYVVIAAGGHSTAGTKIGDHLVAFALPE